MITPEKLAEIEEYVLKQLPRSDWLVTVGFEDEEERPRKTLIYLDMILQEIDPYYKAKRLNTSVSHAKKPAQTKRRKEYQ